MSARRLVAAAVALLLFAPLATPAKGDYIPPCTPPDGAVSVPLEQVPLGLIQALRDYVGEIVAPGEKFDATDVVRTRKNRRFIFLWNSAGRWIIATEHGGRGYNDPIFVYQLGEDRQHAVLVTEKIAFPWSVCAVARDLAAAR